MENSKSRANGMKWKITREQREWKRDGIAATCNSRKLKLYQRYLVVFQPSGTN